MNAVRFDIKSANDSNIRRLVDAADSKGTAGNVRLCQYFPAVATADQLDDIPNTDGHVADLLQFFRLSTGIEVSSRIVDA